MAKNESLFEESSQGAVGAITAFMVIISFVLVFGGILLMSYAFGSDVPGALFFSLGLGASTLGFILPLWVLPATRK